MGFSFSLLSDEDRTVARLLGAERDPDDRFPDYPRRVTFLIDPAGVIRESWAVASDEIPGHPEAVLAALRTHQEVTG